jgi:iron complex transport system substrate-binding protein
VLRFLAILLTIVSVILPVHAQETRPFAHDMGSTDIPVHPQRIITLHDVGLTLPLIELGVMPIASSGRVRADGSIYLRAGKSLLGIDFDNSDIAFVDARDMEAITALAPDLIITNQSDEDLLRQYNLIAPTITLDRYNRTGTEHFRALADAVGAVAKFEMLQARLDWQIDALRQAVPDAADVTVTIMHSSEPGAVVASYVPTFGSLGHVLTEVGFKQVPLMEEIREEASISAERLAELDADFIIVTYRNDTDETPATARAAMEAGFPGWCEFLHACRNDQVLFLPRDEAFTVAYSAMDLAIATIHAAIAGRDFTPISAKEQP